MPVSRRTIVLGAGSAGLALIGAGTTFAVTRTPTRALAPWSDLTAAVDDIRLDAFRHAILAPNPHNRQPWMIELVGQTEAVIRCDLSRRLPHTDPFDRQITIGFGCFLELARIAAAQRGVRIDMTPFPAGEPAAAQRLDISPIATLSFVRDAKVARDPLFAAVTQRRSSKMPFDTARPVPSATLAALRGDGVVTSDERTLVADLRRITWDAWMIEAETARTFRESVDLMRIGKSEIEANPDGIAIGGVFMEALAATGQLSRALLADPTSMAYKTGIDKYRPILASAMAYAWITTAGNMRRDQLDAGRRYVRLNLAANAAGLSLHPVSQALQEFPEMAKPFEAARDRLSVGGGETLQMLARVGYAPAQPPAARWPLESKVIRT